MKKNDLKQKIKCKNCGCSDVVVSNATAGLLGVGFIFFLLATSCSMWIPLVGLILVPIFFIATVICLVGFVVTLLGMKYNVYCKGCNSKYKVSKREYIKLSKKGI